MNRSEAGSPGFTWPGEQAMPAGFLEVELPNELDTIRARLFGADPDRAMLNYRVWQYMRLLHSTPELEGFVLDLDPRITYLQTFKTDLFEPDTFKPVVTQIAGIAAELFIAGSGASPDASGRMYHQYRVDVLSASTVGIEQQTKPLDFTIHDTVYTDGLSNRVTLGGSGYDIMLSTDEPSAEYRVSVFNRPSWELGDIAVAVESVGEPVLLELFGVAPTEPFLTFKNLWTSHRELPFKLGGLLLALIYRTNLIRGTIG